MLGSITPLGERGRNSHWSLTVVAFILASTVAGGSLGAVLGGAGGLLGLGGSTAALPLLAAALLVGLVLDLGLGGLRLPTVTRQVDDQWLYRYRGWVTGVGFGLQLGVGVATIVTTAFTYVTFFAAALTGSVLAGALVGGTYGAVRAATILVGSRVNSPERLVRMHERLRRWDAPARRGALALQGALLAVAVALVTGNV